MGCIDEILPRSNEYNCQPAEQLSGIAAIAKYACYVQDMSAERMSNEIEALKSELW